MRAVLISFKDVFVKEVDVSRPAAFEPHVIVTTHDAPVGRRDRSHRPADHEAFINVTTARWLQIGIVEDSRSLYSSPIVLANKLSAPPPGKRLCNDFRSLNEITIPLEVNIPTIESVLNALPNSRFFSKFDCTSGYFQMQLDESTRHKTAFTTRQGTLQYMKESTIRVEKPSRGD